MAQLKKGVRRKKKDTTHPAEFKVRRALIAGMDVNDPTAMAWWKEDQEKKAAEAIRQASTRRRTK
jgi:hypothetical protein